MNAHPGSPIVPSILESTWFTAVRFEMQAGLVSPADPLREESLRAEEYGWMDGTVTFMFSLFLSGLPGVQAYVC